MAMLCLAEDVERGLTNLDKHVENIGYFTKAAARDLKEIGYRGGV